VKLFSQFNDSVVYLRFNEKLHQIPYERSVGEPFLASLGSDTCNCLFIWDEKTFIQELTSCLGNSSVRRIYQLIHMLTILVSQNISVVPNKK
jgi:hypothetical protein